MDIMSKNENSPEYLREHEEEIVDNLFQDQNIDLTTKKRLYIKQILDSRGNSSDIEDKDLETILDEIISIAGSQRISILELHSIYDMGTKAVFQLGDKIIKFNKDKPVIKNRYILEPGNIIKYGKDNAMTVFEKLDVKGVVKVSDEADQLMYNRLRDCGYIWLDVHMDNIGVTSKRIDETDDGLRVIDAEDVKDYYQLLESMKPVKNQYGIPDKQLALEIYLKNIGYLYREEEYKRYVKNKWVQSLKVEVPKDRKRVEKKDDEQSKGIVGSIAKRIGKIFKGNSKNDGWNR